MCLRCCPRPFASSRTVRAAFLRRQPSSPAEQAHDQQYRRRTVKKKVKYVYGPA